MKKNYRPHPSLIQISVRICRHTTLHGRNLFCEGLCCPIIQTNLRNRILQDHCQLDIDDYRSMAPGIFHCTSH